MTVTYAKAAVPVRSAQQQASVANKSATSASQKATQATPTQTVEANQTANTVPVGKTNQGRVSHANVHETKTPSRTGRGAAPIAATNTTAKVQGKQAKGSENRDNNQKLASILKRSVEQAQASVSAGNQASQREG